VVNHSNYLFQHVGKAQDKSPQSMPTPGLLSQNRHFHSLAEPQFSRKWLSPDRSTFIPLTRMPYANISHELEKEVVEQVLAKTAKIENFCLS